MVPEDLSSDFTSLIEESRLVCNSMCVYVFLFKTFAMGEILFLFSTLFLFILILSFFVYPLSLPSTFSLYPTPALFPTFLPL